MFLTAIIKMMMPTIRIHASIVSKALLFIHRVHIEESFTVFSTDLVVLWNLVPRASLSFNGVVIKIAMVAIPATLFATFEVAHVLDEIIGFLRDESCCVW